MRAGTDLSTLSHAEKDALIRPLLPLVGQLDAALAYLQGRRLLLMLDNFEHVLSASALVVEVLSAAGFHTETADTPEKATELQALPARQVLPQTRDGKTSYVYRDPSVCHCLYVGGEPEYQQYQKLRLQKDIADEESSAPKKYVPSRMEPSGFKADVARPSPRCDPHARLCPRRWVHL